VHGGREHDRDRVWSHSDRDRVRYGDNEQWCGGGEEGRRS
jgi:hypothetical protein